MARISLRAYNRDIETMIDQNQIDEAIAHCRHIFGRYPKHIATYRLMGKALLEVQRFGDASDVFHRVLSSVPDDFIAHLGMSIIREDEGNLDGAIWHMERAFEVQPSNAAVQDELRRLYRLRDGLTPQKIQLTRGALARMSAKSNLYSQAIAELRSALTDDPQRPDLQVVLAVMYAQTAARIEAIETCNALVSKLPYCWEANRILSELLPETERAKEAQEYKQRLSELDPYFAHLSAVATTVDLVPDSAVTLEKLEYQGEITSPQEPTQPAWATTLGVTLDEDSDLQEEAPEWLSPESEETPMVEESETVDDMVADQIPTEGESRLEEETETPLPEPLESEKLPGLMEAAEEGEEEAPEWLQTVMGEPSEVETFTPEAAVAGIVLTDDIQDETILTESESELKSEEDEFPEIGVSAEDHEEEAATDSLPEEKIEYEAASLDGVVTGGTAAGLVIGAGLEDEEIQEPEEYQPEQETVPDDQSLEIEVPAESSSVEDQIPDVSPDEESKMVEEEEQEIPDWLQGLGEGIPEVTPSETVFEPELVEEQAEFSEQLEPETSIEAGGEWEEEEEFPESIPEWLSTVSPGGTPDLALAEELETSLSDEEEGIVRAEIPLWLRKMEQEHLAEMRAVSEGESLEALEYDSDLTDLTGEDVPSWLISAMEGGATIEALEYETTEDVEGIIAELAKEEAVISEVAEEEAVVSELPQEEAVTSTLAEGEAVVSETAEEEAIISEIAEEEALVSEVPLEEGPVEEAILEGDTQPIVVGDLIEVTEPEHGVELEEEVPLASAEIEAAEIEAVPPTGEDEEAAMAWLESLAARQGVDEEELLTKPEERLEEPPEWVQETVLDEELSPEEEVAEEIPGITAAAVAGYAIEQELQKEEEEGESIGEEEEILAYEAPEWIPEAITKEEPTELKVGEIPPEIEEALEAEEAPFAIVDETQPSEAVEQPVEEFPEWLSGLAPEEEISPEEAMPEWAPTIISEEAKQPEETLEELITTKVDLNAASLAQLEKIPGIGFILAQNIVSYRDSAGPFQSVDELENVPNLPQGIVDDLKNYLTVAVVEEVSTPISTHPELQEAWTSMASGDISKAVNQYSQLIKQDEHLDEIIRDLQEALTNYPVDVSLYQTLGDAYLRANMLQEALDAYNRAEDLIK